MQALSGCFAKALKCFEVMGLFVHVFRDPVACINKKGGALWLCEFKPESSV